MPCGPRSISTRLRSKRSKSGVNSDSEIDAFVEIDADLLLDARLVADDLAGGDAADRDLALAGAEVLDGEAGDVAADVLERLRIGALDVLLRSAR